MQGIINPNKTKTIKELGKVDITEFKQMVMSLPDEYWEEHNRRKPNSFGALSQTQHIVFKFVRNFQSHRESVEYPVWKSWQDKIEPLLQTITKSYGYQDSIYPRIMLAKLPGGCRIPLHIDRNPAANYPHKIHIPIQTNPQAYFFVGKQAYHFAEGYGYEVNNKAKHGVINNGNTPRIHLIFEYADVPAKIASVVR